MRKSKHQEPLAKIAVIVARKCEYISGLLTTLKENSPGLC